MRSLLFIGIFTVLHSAPALSTEPGPWSAGPVFSLQSGLLDNEVANYGFGATLIRSLNPLGLRAAVGYHHGSSSRGTRDFATHLLSLQFGTHYRVRFRGIDVDAGAGGTLIYIQETVTRTNQQHNDLFEDQTSSDFSTVGYGAHISLMVSKAPASWLSVYFGVLLHGLVVTIDGETGFELLPEYVAGAQFHW